MIFPLSVFPQDRDDYPTVKAVVNPEKATAGQVIEYSVTIAGKNSRDVKILLPEKRIFYPDRQEKKKDPAKKQEKQSQKISAGKNDSAVPETAKEVPLYIIHSAQKKDSSEEGMTYLTVNVKLSFYRPGHWLLPEIEIFGSDKIKIGYRVPGVEISELNPESKLEEIEPPLDLGGNYFRLIMLIAGAVILTLLGVFLFRYIRKKRREKAADIVPVPPIEVFMDEIHRLEGKRLIEEDRIEEYVVGISQIFRRFLSSLLGFDALEMTTDEIDDKLKKLLSKDAYIKYHDVVMNSFNLWDLSKFAEFTPSSDVLLANLEKTRSIGKKLSEDVNDG